MAKPQTKGCLFDIKDDNVTKIGACPVWKNNNSILIYPGQKKSTTIENHHSGTPSNMYEIQWNTTLYNAVTRKLVNEAHGIFVSFHQSIGNAVNETNKTKEICISTSHKYRSVINACIFNLSKPTGSVTEDEVKDFTAQSELFYTIELIWHLCEILYIDVQPGGLVLNQLLEWIQWHSNDGEDKANEAMEFETPYTHNSYWEAIYCFLLQGKLENARTFLKIHNCAERDDFRSMDELLRKMPTYNSARQNQNNQPVAEFSLKWRFWQDECQKRLQDGEFTASENLTTMCRILCGVKQTFYELSHLCGSWYHLMVSELLYTNPCVKVHNLSKIAKECVEAFGALANLQESDVALLAAIDFDLSKLLHELCLIPDSWWFVAHLTDLLHAGQQLEMHKICHPDRLREFMVINFASPLMDHSSLWQVGIDYLDTCCEFGRDLIETYLEHIPLHTTAKALKLLAIAKKKDLNNLTNSICKTMATQSLRNGQIGTALMWAVRAEDTVFATHIADKFLEEYRQNGKFSDLNLLDNLGSCMLVSDRLTFLGKYREFHRMYGEKEFRNAADLLISLLASNLAPKNFWLTLLLDAIPLLEAEDIIMSSQQTYQLLYCLEELIGFPMNESSATITGDHEEKISLLRLSIGRNLARAFIEEGSFSA